MSVLLHIGCGPKRKNQTTRGFNTDAWQEVRLDIDQSVSPDVIGSMTDMSAVETGSVDAIFSSHNVEHLYPVEVPVAFAEFARVLKEDGFAVITCPDLKSVAKLVAEDKLTEPAYVSPAGPITPMDILFGHQASVARGNHYMAHKGGFTEKVLVQSLLQAGFKTTISMARAQNFDLWVLASKSERGEEELRGLAGVHFPG